MSENFKPKIIELPEEQINEVTKLMNGNLTHYGYNGLLFNSIEEMAASNKRLAIGSHKVTTSNTPTVLKIRNKFAIIAPQHIEKLGITSMTKQKSVSINDNPFD